MPPIREMKTTLTAPQNQWQTGFTWLFISVLASVLINMPAPVQAENTGNGIQILSTEYRNRGSFDYDSFRILIKNNEAKPLTISDCRINKIISRADTSAKQSNLGDTIPFFYAKLSPPRIKNSCIGELTIKLGKNLLPSKPYRCTFKSSSDRWYNTDILTQTSVLRMASAGFPADSRRAHIYVHNQSNHKIEITSIEINQSPTNQIIAAINNPIPPKQKACFTINTERILKQGEYLHITINLGFPI